MAKNNQKADRGRNKKAGNTPQISAEEERANLARELGLKPKSKEMIDMLLEDPKLSQTEAYMRLHSGASRRTAATAASELMRKPQARIYSDRAVGKAKRKMVSLVDSNNENIALKASADILDRTEGKAVQKSENVSRTVEVKLDLTGVRLGAHYIKPEQLQQ